MAPTEAEPASGTFRALRHRNFRLFIGGQIVSLAGTWMQSLAQSWLVYRLTHSTLVMGTIGFGTQIPVLILAPIGGLVADRLSRRRIVITTQTLFLIQAAVLGALTLTGSVTIGSVLILSILWGIINAFDVPARQSLFVQLVAKEDLPNAIALNSMTFNAARIVGPSIGGFFVAAFGEGLCFVVNAFSFLAVIGSLVAIRVVEPAKHSGASPWEHLKEGFRYAWSERQVRALLILTAFANLALTPVMLLGPVFADAVFHKGSQGFGMLTGAMGLGAVVGTMVLARSGDDSNLAMVVMVGTIMSAVALVIYSLSPWFELSLFAMTMLGFSIFRLLAASNSMIQTSIRDDFRGRVMSLYSMTVIGVLPIGNLISGAVAHWIGSRATVMAGAGLSLVAAVTWTLELKRRRRG